MTEKTKSILVVLGLILFGPFGLILMYLWRKDWWKKTSIKTVAAIWSILYIIIALTNQPSKNNEEPVVKNPESSEVSAAEIQNATNKCMLLEASDIYAQEENITEIKLFEQAKNTCEKKKSKYEEDLNQYVEEVLTQWEKENDKLIADKPLTYYLEELNKPEHAETEDGALVFVSKLQSDNEEKRKAEEVKAKEEAEAKAAAEAATRQETANSAPTAQPQVQVQQSQPQQAPAEDPNLPLKATCADGTVQYQDTPSHPNYQGMCSKHGGVQIRHGRVP